MTSLLESATAAADKRIEGVPHEPNHRASESRVYFVSPVPSAPEDCKTLNYKVYDPVNIARISEMFVVHVKRFMAEFGFDFASALPLFLMTDLGQNIMALTIDKLDTRRFRPSALSSMLTQTMRRVLDVPFSFLSYLWT
jgi:hypothetical protein